MAKYFIDTEFLEGKQDKTMLGIKYGETKPTIDLISIGIVAEDGREYYAISKDFNLKEAWNRYQWKDWHSVHGEELHQKEYWIRENVLRPLFHDLRCMHNLEIDKMNQLRVNHSENWLSGDEFSFSVLKKLLKKYGKTNEQITKEIKEFIYKKEDILYNHQDCKINNIGEVKSNIQLYAYYADYDWVAFCWLFGKMNDLPKGFPMYCTDLKQTLDSKEWHYRGVDYDHEGLKRVPDYPTQNNNHNALADAKWNYELYKFIQTL